jgi:phosphate transport system substrate-binding protein
MHLHLRVPALALSALLVLTACGPGSNPSASSGATTAPAAATTAPAAAAASPAAAAASPAAAAASPAAAAASPAASPAAAAVAPPAAGASPAAPVVSVTGPLNGEAQNLTGAGSTLAAPLYQKWFDVYKGITNVQVNYQPIGSGGGIQAIQQQTVDWGASDAPMTNDQLAAAKGGTLYHIPTALGSVVLTYNIPGVTTSLKLTGDDIAGIYLGNISKWNDAKLTADNPELANVNQDIVTVHRSDGSGTTYTFTDYLSAVSPDFKSQVGAGTSVNWPGGLGGSGSAGVTGQVQQTTYSIGYVEVTYALQNKLPYAFVKNQAGNFIDPSNLESMTAALANSISNVPPDLRFDIVNAPGETSYPISTGTWILAYQNYTDRAKALAIVRMLWWGIHDGQQYNQPLQYGIIPAQINATSESFIKQMTYNGQPIFPDAIPG